MHVNNILKPGDSKVPSVLAVLNTMATIIGGCELAVRGTRN